MAKLSGIYRDTLPYDTPREQPPRVDSAIVASRL
jgi:hypothetical protein